MQSIDANKLYPTKGLTDQQLEIRQLALNDFVSFIRLMAPYQLLAHCHVDLAKWIQEHIDENKLILWPRDHGKSRMSAFFAAWEVCRDPSTTIIYASATAEKAEEQLRFIKDILSSRIARRYFPNLISPQEGQRESWNKTYIVVDHPYRKEQGVVDSTIMTCGLEKTITGKHCKRLVLDDVVVPENNNEEGRKKVNAWVAQAASIMSADSSILAVGTRYHPKDAYQMMMDMSYDDGVEDVDGETKYEPKNMFVISIANVETDGEFLWPRTQRSDGKYFGFNSTILAKKRAVYEAAGEITQFYAQYYNDPNDKSTAPIGRDLFKYYKKTELEYSYGLWTIEGRPCYIFAAIDLATSTKSSSDYTAITIGAIDDEGNRYLVEACRFKTDKISAIFQELRNLYSRYRYRKLRIEAVAGFKLVAQDLAEKLNSAGIRIPIDFYVPPTHNTDGKEARVNSILEPLYQAGVIYHYRGGNAQVLEDELCQANPAHDDLKDSWAMCNHLMEAPLKRRVQTRSNVVQYHPRFGGIAL